MILFTTYIVYFYAAKLSFSLLLYLFAFNNFYRVLAKGVQKLDMSEVHKTCGQSLVKC